MKRVSQFMFKMFTYCIFGVLAAAVTVFSWDKVLFWACLKNKIILLQCRLYTSLRMVIHHSEHCLLLCSSVFWKKKHSSKQTALPSCNCILIVEKKKSNLTKNRSNVHKYTFKNISVGLTHTMSCPLKVVCVHTLAILSHRSWLCAFL